jgi:hypothetical protein
MAPRAFSNLQDGIEPVNAEAVMASTAKAVSSLSVSSLSAPRRERRGGWAWLALVRESFGGALLLVVWLALWTVTWAAVAGPLAPEPRAPAASAEVGT